MQESVFLELSRDVFFFESDGVKRDLIEGEKFLGQDLFLRNGDRFSTIYYMDSSDQIQIPRQYVNFFRILNRREGGRIKQLTPTNNLEDFIRKGIYLSELLEGIDSRGARNLLGKMVILGTKEFRGWTKKTTEIDFQGWTLSNIRSTLEI